VGNDADDLGPRPRARARSEQQPLTDRAPRRSTLRQGSGRSSTARTTVNTEGVAPTPSATTVSAAAANTVSREDAKRVSDVTLQLHRPF
jgi:hypothetical protein